MSVGTSAGANPRTNWRSSWSAASRRPASWCRVCSWKHRCPGQRQSFSGSFRFFSSGPYSNRSASIDLVHRICAAARPRIPSGLNSGAWKSGAGSTARVVRQRDDAGSPLSSPSGGYDLPPDTAQRTRDGSYLPPPAQIPACGFSAPGSCRRSDATGIRGLGGPSSSGPWARAVGDMPVPALCPGHALALALPSTGRLPSTLSAISPSAGVVRGFIGTMQPSDSSDLPVRLRLLAFPNRPGTARAAAGGPRSPRFRHDP